MFRQNINYNFSQAFRLIRCHFYSIAFCRGNFINQIFSLVNNSKCIACGAEGRMVGKGTTLTCPDCGKTHELTPLGKLEATDGNNPIPHIPDYYAWEREQVRQEILAGTYRMELDVKIGMLVDFKAIYMVGEGKLVHDRTGFTLTGCDGKLHYTQKPTASHSLNSDFFWYEVGDVIGLGDSDKLFYCFPQNAGDVVAKAHLAAEELYKLNKDRRRSGRESV